MINFRSLESCAYSANVFKETLNKIQKAVDDLSLRQYSNLHAWVGKLDEAVEAKLALRLQVCLIFLGIVFAELYLLMNLNSLYLRIVVGFAHQTSRHIFLNRYSFMD